MNWMTKNFIPKNPNNDVNINLNSPNNDEIYKNENNIDLNLNVPKKPLLKYNIKVNKHNDEGNNNYKLSEICDNKENREIRENETLNSNTNQQFNKAYHGIFDKSKIDIEITNNE